MPFIYLGCNCRKGKLEGRESGVLRLPFQNRVHYVFMDDMDSAFHKALVLRDLEWNLRRKCDTFSEFGRDFYCRIQRSNKYGREHKMNFTCWSRSVKCANNYTTTTKNNQGYCAQCKPKPSRKSKNRPKRRGKCAPTTATCIQIDSYDTANAEHTTLSSADMAHLPLEPILDTESTYHQGPSRDLTQY